ncbi:Fic family protein [Conexibacter sp. JD483]|uniref:Fic family protein n=1 Tax=unclassified Conexibacter TaxID=2627773 RepID=UPI002722F434|nr:MULTISPECIES: Fic family protein [unclassified Conexibacter]MDO8185511.1 Fic family protein [Conexibacter sp. CPCC 205706]MDO8197302.1 Fic family protein [Conexibacter sp. CPCC 205762]MDR9370198.1 Fic family protein [Conexibacter sp. JD483]
MRLRQPELLDSLALQTRVASIMVSTAIEGHEVEPARAEKLVRQADARMRNRNEREFAGYRDAIEGLMAAEPVERVSLPLLLHLHRQLYLHSGGQGGRLKHGDNEIVFYDETGRRQLIFRPPPWQETEFLLTELVERYRDACERAVAHPLLLLGAFVLDLLAIHPVADGNGRLARLLTTNELLRNDYGVARYASVEQRIYASKQSYYAALRQSQVGWHEGEHDLWPWIEYLVTVLGESYDDFEGRIAAARSTAGLTKQEVARRHVLMFAFGRTFRLRDLRAALHGISDPTFRLVLTELRREGEIGVEGSGQGAVWTRLVACRVAARDLDAGASR